MYINQIKSQHITRTLTINDERVNNNNWFAINKPSSTTIATINMEEESKGNILSSEMTA